MDDTNIEKRGIDPSSATGTRDAIDPETGVLGTAGTPMTAGYGMSGSTIGVGSHEGREEYEKSDFEGETPGTKGYTTGQSQRSEPIPAPKPSQAEGDRETIE